MPRGTKPVEFRSSIDVMPGFLHVLAAGDLDLSAPLYMRVLNQTWFADFDATYTEFLDMNSYPITSYYSGGAGADSPTIWGDVLVTEPSQWAVVYSNDSTDPVTGVALSPDLLTRQGLNTVSETNSASFFHKADTKHLMFIMNHNPYWVRWTGNNKYLSSCPAVPGWKHPGIEGDFLQITDPTNNPSNNVPGVWDIFTGATQLATHGLKAVPLAASWPVGSFDAATIDAHTVAGFESGFALQNVSMAVAADKVTLELKADDLVLSGITLNCRWLMIRIPTALGDGRGAVVVDLGGAVALTPAGSLTVAWSSGVVASVKVIWNGVWF